MIPANNLGQTGESDQNQKLAKFWGKKFHKTQGNAGLFHALRMQQRTHLKRPYGIKLTHKNGKQLDILDYMRKPFGIDLIRPEFVFSKRA